MRLDLWFFFFLSNFSKAANSKAEWGSEQPGLEGDVSVVLSAYMQVEAIISGNYYVVEGNLGVFVLRENVLQWMWSFANGIAEKKEWN